MKKKISMIIAFVMIAACFMVPASVFAAENTATITMYVYDKTEKDAVPTVIENVVVPADAAENAGYTFDDPANSGAPTVLDALTAQFGDEFKAEYYELYGSASITKLFGQDYPACGYYVNNSSDPTQLTCDTMQLKDGDLLTVYLYKDAAGWSDKYMFFDKTAYSAEEGETFSITVSSLGYDANWNVVASLEAERTVVITDGTNTYEAVSDANGVAVFEDVTEGDYTATVKLASENEFIVMPYAKVNVTAADESDDTEIVPEPEEDADIDGTENDNTGNTENGEKEDTKKSPETGDDFNAVPFVLMALAAMTVGTLTCIRRRA